MNTQQLETGQKVRIVVPFTYEIGEEGYHSGKTLRTIQDCKDEVLAEIEADVLKTDGVFMKVKK